MPAKKLEIAFVTSKKVGKAVARNSIRRRLRAALLTYEDKILIGKYIFIAKEPINQRDYKGLIKDFNFAFSRLKLLK